MKKGIKPKQIMDLVNDQTGSGMEQMLLLRIEGGFTIVNVYASEQKIATMIKGYLAHAKPGFRKMLILELAAEEFNLGGANDDEQD